MENRITEKPKMSAVLGSNAIKELCNSLSLTDEQINRAKSSALELSTNPNLASCDPFSLVKFCFETARYNFSRNDCIYPVPYKDKVQAQMGYKGFRELCLRSGAYDDINCSEVYKCDKVFRDTETGKVKVVFNENIESLEGEPIGFYAYAIDKEGKVVNSLYWSKEKCIEHGKYYSKSYDKIWGGREFSKMAKKTVLKQLCSDLKTTPELETAIKMDQIVFGKNGEENDYLDIPNIRSTNNKAQVQNSIIENEEEEIRNVISELF